MRGIRNRRVIRIALLAAVLIATTTPSAFAQSETIEYYGLDALGSVRAIFDQQGNVLARMDYGPFGENLRAAIKFPAEQFAQLSRDAENGQDYAQARNYLPATGRFTRVDPVFAGLFAPQAWNRYAYAMNNPLMFVDPTGLVAEADGRCSWTETVTEDGLISHLSCLSDEMWAFLNKGVGSVGGGSNSGTDTGDIGGGGFIKNFTGDDLLGTLNAIDGLLNTTQDWNACINGAAALGCLSAVTAVIPGGKATKPSSRALNKALSNAGFVKKLGEAAHHIVPGAAKAAEFSRSILRKYGIGINAAENGVYLPANLASPNLGGAAVHSTVHTNSYYQMLEDLLRKATSSQEVTEALDWMRQWLVGGGR